VRRYEDVSMNIAEQKAAYAASVKDARPGWTFEPHESCGEVLCGFWTRDGSEGWMPGGGKEEQFNVVDCFLGVCTPHGIVYGLDLGYGLKCTTS
jgi:hypothetical protein